MKKRKQLINQHITLLVDKKMLAEIERRAKKNGQNRSEYLRALIVKDLGVGE